MKVTVRSHLAQPVELHFGPRTVVLVPHGHVEIDSAEAASDQIRYLQQAGLLTLHHPTPAPAEGKKRTGGEESPRKATSKGRNKA